MEDEVFIMSRVQDEEHCVPDGFESSTSFVLCIIFHQLPPM